MGRRGSRRVPPAARFRRPASRRPPRAGRRAGPAGRCTRPTCRMNWPTDRGIARCGRAPPGPGSRRPVAADDAVVAQGVGHLLDVRGGPARLPHPPAGPFLVGGGRGHALLHPGADHGAFHDAVLDALEPVVPPADDLLEVPDGRAGLAEVGQLVRPGPDESLTGDVDAAQEPGDGVGVAVRPAAGGQYGALQRLVVLTERGVPPVVVAFLVAQPFEDPGAGGVQPFVPHVPPPVADGGGVGRAGGVGEHGARLGQVVGEHRAADVVHVVRVPVVREGRDDDGAQARRPHGRRPGVRRTRPRRCPSCRCGRRTRAVPPARRALPRRRAAPVRGTRRAGRPRIHRSPAGPRVRRRSRGPRCTGGGWRRGWRSGRSCGRGSPPGSPVPVGGRRWWGARSSPTAGPRPTW